MCEIDHHCQNIFNFQFPYFEHYRVCEKIKYLRVVIYLKKYDHFHQVHYTRRLINALQNDLKVIIQKPHYSIVRFFELDRVLKFKAFVTEFLQLFLAKERSINVWLYKLQHFLLNVFLWSLRVFGVLGFLLLVLIIRGWSGVSGLGDGLIL